jgi:hypothetical protein
MQTNPKRPPRAWWSHCTRGVRESGSAQDPRSVCGALWYHRMSAEQRRAAARRSERSLAPNVPEVTPLGWLVLAGIGIGTWWALKNAPEPKPSTTSGLLGPVAYWLPQ